jgi:trehalose-6-phosphatase
LGKGKNDITIYLGDDITDEDVFRALGPRDISIRIGKSKSSYANYYIARKELIDLLNYLACGKN